MAIKKKSTSEKIDVVRVERKSITICIKGTTPLIVRRMSEKVKQELMLPSGRKTASEKKSTLKHDPYEEFADSPYTSANPKSPTLLLMPSVAFKSAMRNVAVDVPNASSKAQLGRLTYVEGDYVPIYGTPQIKMDVVRSRDMNRTPDVRTRLVVPEWATIIQVIFAVPILNASTITALMVNAGIIQGVGDYRAEKGAGNFGSWEVVQQKDIAGIMKIGRKDQEIAMKDPQCYDSETAELLSWFTEAASQRGFSHRGALEGVS